MRVLFWGTYDLGKPRNRILIQGLRENGVEVVECHAHVWAGIEDKSQVRGGRLRFALRWLAAYPRLLWRYLCAPEHDLVVVGYLGQLDLPLIRPLTWLRRKPLVWDTFLSLHDTIVDDRKLIGPRHPLAVLVYAWEWLCMRLPDLILVDTEAHGRFFVERFGARPVRVQRVFVGVEPQAFFPSVDCQPAPPANAPYRVLFYGQFIPLHGIEVIAQAARLCADEGIRWEVIGDGQETERFRALLQAQGPLNLAWTPWVRYDELIHRIHQADLCLGIFGTSGKALRVIPNKVYQVLAAGRALITADTPAARELLSPGPGIILVPPGDAAALAAAIREMRRRPADAAERQLRELRKRIQPKALGRDLLQALQACRKRGKAAAL
jgi:glycosyltransferase involved in cell wall biosynthesis